MTTTELIKILKDNECGGITHKPRKLSLTINGKYMPNPQITLSSTGDGICGAEIDLDIDGEFMEEQEPKTGHWNSIPKYPDIAWYCSECEHFTTMKHRYCPNCGAKMVEPQESGVEDGKDHCQS